MRQRLLNNNNPFYILGYTRNEYTKEECNIQKVSVS